eukprot:scaffold232832_cov31-Prasinocladus_malaysianus.AAC.1
MRRNATELLLFLQGNMQTTLLNTGLLDKSRRFCCKVWRSYLVQEHLGESNAKHGGRDGQAALAEAVLRVEVVDRFLAGLEAARLPDALVPDRPDVVGLHGLAVVGQLALLVEVELADQVGGPVDLRGDALHDALHGQDGLGAAKAAERRVGRLVGPAEVAGQGGVGDLVGVVDADHAALHDVHAEVQAVAGVAVHVHLQGHQPALPGHADLVFAH